MRRIARVDANQPAIISALRQAGADVFPLHTVGSGCPDLLVGFRGVNLLLEVKDGSKPARDRRLTDDEQAFFERWRGQKAVVKCVDEALDILRYTGVR